MICVLESETLLYSEKKANAMETPNGEGEWKNNLAKKSSTGRCFTQGPCYTQAMHVLRKSKIRSEQRFSLRDPRLGKEIKKVLKKYTSER
jgi:hypothetical protein